MRFLAYPDLEAVVRKTIADAGYRAYSSVPNTPIWPLCVVQRAGGFAAVRGYLDAPRIQVDVWGGAKGDTTPVTKSTLQDMAQDVIVIVLELEGKTITSPVNAFVSGVEDGGMQWLPDDRTGRERYVVLFEVYGRALLSQETP